MLGKVSDAVRTQLVEGRITRLRCGTKARPEGFTKQGLKIWFLVHKLPCITSRETCYHAHRNWLQQHMCQKTQHRYHNLYGKILDYPQTTASQRLSTEAGTTFIIKYKNAQLILALGKSETNGATIWNLSPLKVHFTANTNLLTIICPTHVHNNISFQVGLRGTKNTERQFRSNYTLLSDITAGEYS